MSLVEKIDRALRLTFYALFFITPLILYPKTFELFEFNKMWVVYGFSLIILFLWGAKMIISEKFLCRRTPFDIPLMLFLASQIISTAFSIDPHISFWGYYSRFNGGLLSLITYIFLYYAFVSNFISDKNTELSENISYKMLIASLLSGTAVAIWGLSSHFGYDLTCLVFRGELNVACWTDAFQPTVRLFSTLGQPNWLAAYFSILIPIALSIGIFKLASFFNNEKHQVLHIKNYLKEKEFIRATLYLLLATLLFIEVLWTASQSGYLGLLSGLGFFTLLFFVFIFKKSSLKKLQLQILGSILLLFFLTSFFMGNPLANRFSFLSLQGILSLNTSSQTQTAPVEEASAIPALEGGGSDSGKIRLIVWTGALEVFKRYPLFGSGVETFAYSYYKVKPIEHNLLSEWDYLYNKAHNEYLNYLATTGIIGFGTYLLFIFWFLFYAIKKILKEQDLPIKIVQLGLTSSFITILVSNFFGFSVVVINLYMFIIPGIFLTIKDSKTDEITEKDLTPIKYISLFILGSLCLYFIFYLLKYWTADQEYNLGYNLQKVQEYVQANNHLTAAVKLIPDEPIYKDELASNLATLSYLLYSQDQATQAAIFKNEAISLSNEITKKYPQNLTFYKTRVRLFFTLAQADPKYLVDAINAVEKAKFLAPTDAKVSYNAGLLYGQKGDLHKAITELHHTLELKPNYRDPRIALASFYKEQADAETDPIRKQELLSHAKNELEFILKNISSDDLQAKEILKTLQ